MSDDTGARMYALALKIAPLLGDDWSVETERESSWNALIYGPNGARIFIAGEHFKPAPCKLEIAGWLPEGSRDVVHYDETMTHKIGASESRGAEVIAREITRRLLPEYLAHLADVTERIAKRNDAAATRAATIVKLAQDFRGSVASNGYKPDEARFGHGSRDYYGSVEIRHDSKSVDLEIHGLPVELARKIAAILRKADAS